VSRLAFNAQGRKRTLIRMTPQGPFHIRFMAQGQRVLRSLGTTIPAVAIQKAKTLIDAAYAGDQVAMRSSKVRSDYPLLREVAERYRERFGTDRRRRRTAMHNIGSLAKIVRLGAGLSLEQARISILDGALVRDYEAAEERRIDRDGNGHMIQASELRIRTTIASTLRMARSMFKKSSLNWFDDLGIPDLKQFRDQGTTSPDRPKPQPLDPGVIEAINAAAPRLKIDDPPVYAAHLLFKFCGLRNGEARSARWSWVTRTADGGGKLGIIYRPNEGYKPKAKTEGQVPIAAAVLAELEQLADGNGFLVPGASAYARLQAVDIRHSKWVGQWIHDRSKTSYELRRYAGSLVYQKTGRIEHAQAFLRHGNVQTTMLWYWYLLSEVAALEPADFAPAVPTQLAIVA
jgi:integrase